MGLASIADGGGAATPEAQGTPHPAPRRLAWRAHLVLGLARLLQLGGSGLHTLRGGHRLAHTMPAAGDCGGPPNDHRSTCPASLRALQPRGCTRRHLVGGRGLQRAESLHGFLCNGKRAGSLPQQGLSAQRAQAARFAPACHCRPPRWLHGSLAADRSLRAAAGQSDRH